MNLFPELLIDETPAEAQTVQSVERSGLPTPRLNPWARQGRTLMREACANPDLAIQQAGLDWNVDKVAMRCADTLDPIPEFAAIRRSDNQGILGVVGKDYEAFQNAQMFQVFKDLSGFPFTIETAGSFQHGRIVWAMAHLPDLGIRIGDDESKTYLLVSNGHTGNRTLLIAPTTIRVICQNTLRLAEAQAKTLANGFILRHTPGIHEAVEAAKETFRATMQAHAATKAAWKYLASKALTKKLEKDFLSLLFAATGPDESERAKTMRKTREDRLAAILASPTSQVRGTKDTAFSLLHAVVEYIDHDRPTRTSEGISAEESRLFSSNFGSGAELKSRAWETILELV